MWLMMKLPKNLSLRLSSGSAVSKPRPLSEYLRYSLVLMVSLVLSVSVCAKEIKTVEELTYGPVFFDYFQQNYFSALIENEYAKASDNAIALSANGKVLEGGMLLSYGLARDSQNIFDSVLSGSAAESVRNRAWFYLARLYYRRDDMSAAANALSNISGVVADEILAQYHYLVSLVSLRSKQVEAAETALESFSYSPLKPYLRFNVAIARLESGDDRVAVEHLEKVINYANDSEELAVLADRARHGLAQISVRSGQWLNAWLHLQSIRTTGLYSNRALLSFGWSAINLQNFDEAIPALKVLTQRSIAIPEVQEARVLLPHLYEQKGSTRKALKAYLVAEQEYNVGIAAVNEARKVIAERNVPEEFVLNLSGVMADSDWNGVQPDVNYQKLTPFLIDLMASNAFQSTLRELGDLYSLRKNLIGWQEQTRQHQLILNQRASELTRDRIEARVIQSSELNKTFQVKQQELQDAAGLLSVSDQQRFDSLLQTSEREMELLSDKIDRISGIEAPYRQTEEKIQRVNKLHHSIDAQLDRADYFIARLEPVMRKIIDSELDKHEERMRYYSAQAQLAKARLYDVTLMSLEHARVPKKDAQP